MHLVEKVQKKKSDEQLRGLVADISLACTKKIKKGGKKALVYALKISNVKLLEEEPAADSGWENTSTSKISRKNQKLAKNLDKHFAKHTAVLITTEGEIKQLYGDKSEEVWVRHMKKGIIELLNSKLHGDIRFVEQSAMGDHSSKYEKTHDSEGNTLIQRVWDQDDFIKPKFNPNHLTVKGKGTVVIDTKGRILLSTMSNSASLEPQQDQHKVFKRMKKKLGYEQGMHPDDMHREAGDSGLFTNSKSKSMLEFKKVVDYDPNAHGHHDDFFDNSDVNTLSTRSSSDETDWLNPRSHILPHSLDMEDEMEQHMNRVKARELRETTNFLAELNKLRKNPDNVKLHAELATFVRLNPKFSLKILKNSFEFVASETDDMEEGTHKFNRNIDYLKSIQSLMLATQTKAGQKAVLYTLTHAQLVHSFLIHSLLIREPTDPIVKLIRKLGKHGLPIHLKKYKKPETDDSEDEDEDVKSLSYMVGADAAGRTKNEKLRDIIVNDILHRLSREDDPDRMMQHINAMGNAREAVPIIIWRQLIGHKGMHPIVQQAAIDSMQYRTNDDSEDEEVRRFLHDIAGNVGIHSTVRASAIRAQGRRHLEKGRGHHSIGHFVRQYHRGDEEIKIAVEEFLYHLGSKKAANILEKLWSKTGLNEFDLYDDDDIKTLGFLSSIRNAFRRFGRTMGDGFKKAGRAIVNTAKKVGSAIKSGIEAIGSIGKKISEAFNKIKAAFSAAQFKTGKRCNGDLCVYDPDMANFVSQQGNLALIKNNKNFGFEKLLGAQVMHLYVGAVGFAGMRLECGGGGKSGVFEWAIFARGAAYGQLFSFKVPLIEAAGEFTKRETGALRDRAFVKLYKSALFDRAIMPAAVAAAINYCGTANKDLVSKSFPNLVNIPMKFMIGPFPVEITISATATFGVKAEYSLCISKLEASAGIVPYLTVGVSCSGALSIIIAKGGLNVKASFSYELIPKLSTKNCRLCAVLAHRVKPITITVGGFLEVGIGPISKKFEKDIFSWSAPTINGNLFEKCVALSKSAGSVKDALSPSTLPDTSTPASDASSSTSTRSRAVAMPGRVSAAAPAAARRLPSYFGRRRRF